MLNDVLNSIKSFFSLKPLTYLGEVSYAIYMFQGLAFEAVRISAKMMGNVPDITVHLLSVSLAILAGPVSRMLIERRFERIKERFPGVGKSHPGSISKK